MSDEDDGISGSQVAGFLLGAILGCIPGGSLYALLGSLGVESQGILFVSFIVFPALLGYAGFRWGPWMVGEMFGWM